MLQLAKHSGSGQTSGLLPRSQSLRTPLETGEPGKRSQIVRLSQFCRPNHPSNWFRSMYKSVSLDIFPNISGMVPLNRFWEHPNCSRLVSSEMRSGRVPSRSFSLNWLYKHKPCGHERTNRCWRCVRSPIQSGMVPVKALRLNDSVFSWVRSLSVSGMAPEILFDPRILNVLNCVAKRRSQVLQGVKIVKVVAVGSLDIAAVRKRTGEVTRLKIPVTS
eukprot:TRINITY_DN2162_c0_g1_i2.p1 TRINITY_DN2162_c0_g1~~TRINITY_DN2162_c0_g1_i2.p1  ORF type:complete len:218 (-),score=21.30 TRINITY_DN2162_c0_g1_i2:479-1132(-)